MKITKFVKKHKKVLRSVAAASVALVALTIILIQKSEKKTVLEIDVEPQDVQDVPFEVSAD